MDFKIPAERPGLDLDEYEDIIELFIETGGNDLNWLENALIKNDAQTVVERSHSLKGPQKTLFLPKYMKKQKR